MQIFLWLLLSFGPIQTLRLMWDAFSFTGSARVSIYSQNSQVYSAAAHFGRAYTTYPGAPLSMIVPLPQERRLR